MKPSMSVANLLNSVKDVELVPGTGATRLVNNDRQAFVIVEIEGDRAVVRRERARRIGAGVTEFQRYNFQTDPNGMAYELRKGADGLWHVVGDSRGYKFILGAKIEYKDYGL